MNLQVSKAGWEVDIIQQNSFIPFIEEAANWQQQAFDEYCKGAWQVANEYINNPELVSTYYPMFNN